MIIYCDVSFDEETCYDGCDADASRSEEPLHSLEAENVDLVEQHLPGASYHPSGDVQHTEIESPEIETIDKNSHGKDQTNKN